jgi:ribosome biogenesis GTPase A
MSFAYLTPARLRILAKQCDLFLEVLDARAPLATRGPQTLSSALRSIPRFIALTKADLADDAVTDSWVRYFKQAHALSVVLISRDSPVSLESLLDELESYRRRKRLFRHLKVIVLGLPNVGKSSLINRLVGDKVAPVGDQPGITRGPQWIRLSRRLLVQDMPGILQPEAASPRHKMILAALGTLPFARSSAMEVALWASRFIFDNRPDLWRKVCSEFRIPPAEEFSDDWPTVSARNLNYLLPGNEPDAERVADRFNLMFRRGFFGKMSIESPPLEETSQ